MNISFIGLGKLGLCSAACFAAKGHHVIGVDSNESHIRNLKSGQSPIEETDLPELLEQARPNLHFTTDYAEAIHASDMTLIIVPTPSTADGSFDNSYVERVLRQMAPALRTKDDFHIIDVVSTVMPTSCETLFRPLLEELTGKVCGKDFGLVYNPEFIALGSVIHNFLNPDMVLIGTSDERSGTIIKQAYEAVVDSQPSYNVMSLTNAEITKLSLNCFVTMKISFANELAAYCESIPSANVDVVTTAIGADTRVGAKYLKGGLGFGGPCFPRDNLALKQSADHFGYELQLSPRVVDINNAIVDRLEQMVTTRVAPGNTVSLLGLSYKAGTHIIEEAQSVMLAKRLAAKGYTLHLHDPMALPHLPDDLANTAELYDNAQDAVDDSDCIVLLTDWPQFHAIDWPQVANATDKKKTFIDCWRKLSPEASSHFDYVAIGLGKENTPEELS